MEKTCVWQELLTMAEEVAKLGAKAIFLELPEVVQFLNLAGVELLRLAKARRETELWENEEME